jgi:peptidoglycan hydrolase-like protein with peptidoglycan-binding domain
LERLSARQRSTPTYRSNEGRRPNCACPSDDAKFFSFCSSTLSERTEVHNERGPERNARLDSAASGGPSIKRAPPEDEPEAVRCIQKALVTLGFSMPLSFPSGEEPDGKFGQETYRTVVSFQTREFPQDRSQWDGRVGKNTLGRMDQLLMEDSAIAVLPSSSMTISRCRRA